jgi:hypothetical protein
MFLSNDPWVGGRGHVPEQIVERARTKEMFRNALFSAALPAHPDIVPIPPLILPMPVVPPA